MEYLVFSNYFSWNIDDRIVDETLTIFFYNFSGTSLTNETLISFLFFYIS